MQLHQDLNKKGVHIIGLSDEEDGKVSDYLKDNETPYYIASGSKSARPYGIRGYPTFFVVNPAGKITHIGHDIEEARKAVEKALKKTPPKSAEAVEKEYEAAAVASLKKADTLYKKKKLSEALEAYEACALDYADTPSGKTAKAKLKSLKLEVAEFEAAEALKRADTLAAAKKYPQAMAAYEKVIDEHGDTASAKKAQTKLDALRNDKSIARDMREAEAAKKCNGWLQMARGFVKHDKPESAKKYYRMIIEQYGDTSFAKIAKEEMSRL